jgi:hypothetical protein
MHNDMMLKKQVNALNESFINFFGGSLSIVRASPLGASNSTTCQICRVSDHITTTCPHIRYLSLNVLSVICHIR